MRTILIRLAELLGLCFIMSPISCALYYFSLIPNTDSAYGIVLLIVTVIFITANVFMLRNCYFDLRNPKMYYILNYAAYTVFMAITAFVHEVFGQVPYAWLFNTLKLLSFSEIDLAASLSTGVTHAIMLIVIAVAPIGMKWVLEIPDEEFIDEEEYIENSEEQVTK